MLDLLWQDNDVVSVLPSNLIDYHNALKDVAGVKCLNKYNALIN